MTQEMIIGNRISALMRTRGMKCGVLGIVIGKTPQTVSKRMKHPETYTVDELIAIAKYFKVDMAELVGGRT